MYVIKGFAPHAKFSDYSQFPDGKIGRPSTLSNTFAKSKRFYADRSVSPNVSIMAFEYLKNDVPDNVDQSTQVHMLEVINFVYDYTITRPNIQVDHAEILNKLIEQFGADAIDFEAGAIVEDTGYFVPEYVGWRRRSDNASFVIWLVDSAFQRQYPNYEITVISPLWNKNSQYPADEFFKPGAVVELALKAITMTEMAKRMQDAKNKFPDTVMDIPSYDYHDPNDGTRIVPAYFGLLFYGLAGFNLDSSKDAIQKLLLDNSSRPREDWVEILPDLFRRTEFYMLPMWRKMAIEHTQLTEGLHSPIVNRNEYTPWAQLWATDYTKAHIDAHATVMTWPWRSIAMLAIGNQENRDAKFELSDHYPDWISVPLTSTDFNRMSKRTREWTETMHDMLYHAETFGQYDVPPNGYTKTTRNGKLYLATVIENVHYLMLCKGNTI